MNVNIQNLYEEAKNNIVFKKFAASETLITEYKCMKEDSIFKVWPRINYFVYILSGKKKWNTIHNEFMVYANEVLFVKKGANITHKFFEKDFSALLIFVPANFIKSVI